MPTAEAAGALGVGTDRYASGPPASALPPDATLRPVRVSYPRRVPACVAHFFYYLLLRQGRLPAWRRAALRVCVLPQKSPRLLETAASRMRMPAELHDGFCGSN